MNGCTNLDHIYPSDGDAKPVDGTPCYCGRRRWNQDGNSYNGPTAPAKVAHTWPPRRGSRVELRSAPGVRRVVAAVDREADMIQIDGRWYEQADVA
jgi:hypothetical protein